MSGETVTALPEVGVAGIVVVLTGTMVLLASIWAPIDTPTRVGVHRAGLALIVLGAAAMLVSGLVHA